jgi:hypothetical protein
LRTRFRPDREQFGAVPQRGSGHHAPSLLATQRPGLDLGEGDYRPEPDVGIIDADYDAGQRFVDKAYLLAEVVSDTDEVIVPGTDRRWIDVKRDLYRSHSHCEALLIIAQDRMEVGLDSTSRPKPAGRRQSRRAVKPNC